MKTKKSSNNVTPVSIEPGALITSDSKSNTILSGLTLNVLLMRGLSFIPTGGNIFHWIFLFSRSKVSAAIIGIIAHFV